MIITKEITADHKINVYKDGQRIYTKWMNTGDSEIVNLSAYLQYMDARYPDLIVRDSPGLICAKAKIRFKTTAEGGRSNVVYPGFRPNHVFEYKENGEMKGTYIGDIQFTHPKILELGYEYIVTVRFSLAMPVESFMNLGRIWWIHEAGHQIAVGGIIEFEKYE